MTNEEAKKMLEAKLKCLTRETSGTDIDCNHQNCDECSLCYEQGNMGEQKEALDIAIKALDQIEIWNATTKDRQIIAPKGTFQKIWEDEQQPCEDCISRRQVLEAIDTWDKYGYTETGCFVKEPKGDYVPYVHYEDIVKCIKTLPSAQPQRRKGKWIFREDMGHQYCCSECGCPRPYVNDYYYKKVIGCPYCLADMREVEE